MNEAEDAILSEFDAAVDELTEAVGDFEHSAGDLLKRERADRAISRFIAAVRPLLSDEAMAFKLEAAYANWTQAWQRLSALLATIASTGGADHSAFVVALRLEHERALQEMNNVLLTVTERLSRNG